MSEIENGGPAFPNMPADPSAYSEWDYGMTLRDYFAAKAMQGLGQNMRFTKETSIEDDMSKLADTCYALADAMLKARTK